MKYLKNKKIVIGLFLLTVGTLGAAIITTNFSVPNTFSAGQVISATAMNQNFDAIENQINKLRQTRAESVVIGKLATGFTHDYGQATTKVSESTRCEMSGPMDSQNIYYSCKYTGALGGICAPTQSELSENFISGSAPLCIYDDLTNGNLQAGSDPRCHSKSECNDYWNDGGSSGSCQVRNAGTGPYFSEYYSINFQNCFTNGSGFFECEINNYQENLIFKSSLISSCLYSDIASGTLSSTGLYCKDASVCNNGWSRNLDFGGAVEVLGPKINLSSVSWDLELNEASSFNPSTGTFTAPSTGRYGININFTFEPYVLAAYSSYSNSAFIIKVNGLPMYYYEGSNWQDWGGNISPPAPVFGSGYSVLPKAATIPPEAKLNLTAGDIVTFDVNCGGIMAESGGYVFSDIYDCVLGGSYSSKNSYIHILRY